MNIFISQSITFNNPHHKGYNKDRNKLFAVIHHGKSKKSKNNSAKSKEF
jgi:hypothetical protein